MHAVLPSLNSVQVCQTCLLCMQMITKGFILSKTKQGVEAKAKKGASWIEFIADSFMYTATVLERAFIN